MKRHLISLTLVLLLGVFVVAHIFAANGWTLIGWNNLGMHCMDSDYSVFSLLPPYNTVQAQLVDPTGTLVKSPTGFTVTYQAIADPTKSINTTSIGKTNFWQYVQALFGASPAPDTGLAGNSMPGSSNKPQSMKFDSTMNWFIGEGIPLTPFDDAGKKNTYPMMRLTAKDSKGNTLATTDVVLPVSDEMDCKTCHASGSDAAAMPKAGWVFDSNPIRDVKLNILRLKDGKLLDPANPNRAKYQAMLASNGFSPNGLYFNAAAPPNGLGKPVLCVKCHTSNALPGLGDPTIHPLTQDIHTLHASVVDPATSQTLGSSSNRSACYRCHPGATTRCLRGVMGNAVAQDGTMEIQCQNCHGQMAAVGTDGRAGWLDEPKCQNCHTGTAINNNGQIQYTTVFDATGQVRQAVDSTYATSPNTPATGLSMYRFSSGHGGVQCAACHGSTHAEFPTSHPNDNIQSTQLQGHVGMLVECTTCHNSTSTSGGGSTGSGSGGGSESTTTRGGREGGGHDKRAGLINASFSSNTLEGPHGMHVVGQAWLQAHPDVAEQSGSSQCQACHGSDYRGTVLSRSQANRTLSTEFGTKVFWRGFQIGCYACHNGPHDDSASRNHAPAVTNASATTTAGNSVIIALKATDADGNPLSVRVVSQTANGTVAINGLYATYFPFAGFTGTDTFTFAAWDGYTNSNLGTVTVTVK